MALMGLESMNFPVVAAAAGSSLVEGPAGVGKDYDAARAESFFEPLPPETVGEFTDWTICFHGRWYSETEILRGEGKGVVLGLRHALRSSQSFGQRVLCLSDNMSLVLGVMREGALNGI